MATERADAAEWLPDEGTRGYTDDRVWVGTVYGPSVDEAGKTASEQVLADRPWTRGPRPRPVR